MYEKYKNVCVENQMEKKEFFKEFQEIWENESSYLGEVKIQFDKNRETMSDSYHLFMNNFGFLDFLSTGRTFYFMKKQIDGW